MGEPAIVRYRGLLCSLLGLAMIVNLLVITTTLLLSQFFATVIFLVMLGLEWVAFRAVRDYA